MLTGVNGFIGSHVAENLIKEGHRVKGLVRKTSNLKLIQNLDIDLYEGDITDAQSICELFKDTEIVIHIAGLASDWGPYQQFYDINVKGTQNVARAAKKNGVKRFVYISSAALYGFRNQRNINEDAAIPESIFPYCRTKKEAEQWLFQYSETSDMELVVLRPGNVFGPRDHTFIEKYLNVMRTGKIIYIDRGKHWTCPVYIENLTKGIIRACFEPKAAGEAFIITDGLEIDWKNFTDKFADGLGIDSPKLSVPFYAAYFVAFLMEMVYKILRLKKEPLLTRYRISNGGRDYHFSIEKSRSVLHYVPKISFDEAVKHTLAWYKGQKVQ